MFVFKEKSAHLDLLSIPSQGRKMSKLLGRIIGCKDKTPTWHLIGFPDGSNIASTVCSGSDNFRYFSRTVMHLRGYLLAARAAYLD